MKRVFWIAAVLLLAQRVGAQPFPVPQDQSSGSAVTYDARGGKYETFKTQTGWVTYGPGGERFDTFGKSSGGTVTYGPAGEKWETFPGPAALPPRGRDGR